MTSPFSTGATPQRARPYALIVIVFIVIEATGIFEQLMVYVALPTLERVLDIDIAAVSWTITVFLLVGAGTVALVGRLGDVYGRRRMLVILLVLSIAGSAVSAALGSYEGILIGRALQGTSAAVFPLLVGIAREAVPAPRVPVLVSLTTGTALIAGSLGALLAGVLLGLGQWRLIFVASGILSIVALLLTIFILPRSVVAPREKTRLDVVGAVLLAPAVAAVLFGIDTGSGAGWRSPLAVGLIVLGVVLIAVWIVVELRITSPMFDLRIFRDPALTMTLVATALIGLGVFAAGSLLNPILMQSPTSLPVGLGLTPTVAALYGLIVGAVGFVLSPVAGRIAARRGAKVTLSIGVVLAIVGFIGFAIGVHNLPVAILATVFTGVGSAFILAGLPNLIVEVVPPHNTGEAVGIIYGVGRTLFEAVGTALVGLLLASSVVPQTTAPTRAAWNIVIVFIVVASAIALIIALLIRKAKPMDQRGEVVEAVAEVTQDPTTGPERNRGAATNRLGKPAVPGQ
ncbi:MFS transporter [Frondihabitans cladoniiphilus]|uniref:MFS transporter n=1 Tax=Frondihabitans cladoniiphilus TaxID=715785 RepID=A0ABP8VNT6_9MICO